MALALVPDYLYRSLICIFAGIQVGLICGFQRHLSIDSSDSASGIGIDYPPGSYGTMLCMGGAQWKGAN